MSASQIPIAEPLVEVRRGALTESRHRGHIVVIEPDGNIVNYLGAPQTVTFLRSSAKPFQAMPLLTSGAAERFGFTDQEVALACASHNGEPIHTEVVASMLEKIGLGPEALKCGIHEPYSVEVAGRLRLEGRAPNVLQNNCSGKHAGMLAVCRSHGWRTEGYRLPGHRMQRQNLEDVARLADVAADDIRTATDGCGVVTFALSLERMARMFASLTASREGQRVADAMQTHPEYIRGAGATDTVLMQSIPGAVAKGGAEGLICGLLPEGTGFALKSADGNHRALRAGLARFLPELGHELREFAATPFRNSRGEVVGEVVLAG